MQLVVQGNLYSLLGELNVTKLFYVNALLGWLFY